MTTNVVDYFQKTANFEENFASRVGGMLAYHQEQEQVCFLNGSSKPNGADSKKVFSYKDFLIKRSDEIPKDNFTIYIEETPIGVAGELTVVNGQSKAGKTTAFVPNLIASSYLEENTEVDTLGIKCVHNNGNPIIYIDTEQTKSRTHKILNLSLNIAGVDKTEQKEHPNNFFVLNIKPVPLQEKKNFVFQSISDIVKDTGKLPFLIIIDGFADLLIDPNNANDSFLLIDEIIRKAEEYRCTIIGFLHMNPNSDKMRGHLGSHSERKAGTVITVEKKNKVHYISPQFIRHGKDFAPIVFNYDTTEQRFKQLTGTQAETARKRATDKDFNKNIIFVRTMQEIIKQAGKASFTYTELKNNLITYYQDKKKPSESMAKKHVLAMKNNEIIMMNDSGEYSLNPSAEFTYS
jgi:hypothetical protein